MEKRIDVHYVTRVEGHGNILVEIRDNEIEKIEWQIPEAPRFFEAIVKDQSYEYLPFITSRICGICSIGHTLASIKAVESALSIEVSDQTVELRKLALHAENMQSHSLHVGFLVLPDLFGKRDIIEVAKEDKNLVKKVLELHKLANRLSDLVAGRTTHPVSLAVGGFYSYPSLRELERIKNEIKNGKRLLEEFSYEMEKRINNFPDFLRETEYIALSKEGIYPFYDGIPKSSDIGYLKGDYREFLKEYVVDVSTAKHSKHVRDSYMVGALARFNINSRNLSDFAKKISSIFDLKAPCYNPFMNSIAQIVEIAHNMEKSIDIINRLLDNGLKEEKIPKIKPKEGRGIGMVEVPRGLLIHDYEIDGRGRCRRANLVIPTNQNHVNIQKDMEKFVPEIMDRSKEEIERMLEMLVRAYDPCISCSTHSLRVRVKWKR